MRCAGSRVGFRVYTRHLTSHDTAMPCNKPRRLTARDRETNGVFKMQISSRRRPRLRSALAVALAALGLAVASYPAGAGKADLSGMKFSPTPLTGKVIWNDLITDDLDTTRAFYGALYAWTFEHSSGKGSR